MSAAPKFRRADAAVSRIDAAIAATGVDAAQVHPAAPQPLPAELLPVEPFPMAALPAAFKPWVSDAAERMHCPPDFVAVPLLVAAASLVARHVGIRPQQRTDWLERGNLWALIVGRPGIMKSPAMAQALAPIERLEAQAAEAFNALATQHQAKAMAAKLRAEVSVSAARAKLKKDGGADVASMLEVEDECEAPTRRRYVVNDLTYEKLGEILAANPDGVLSVRDEMRGLFLSLAREESAPARAFYLQAWSGGRYTFDRIQRGTVTVDDVRISIIGGIQPGPLSELVQQARRGAADDGMIERFLISWPDSPGEWREVDRWPDSEGKRLAWGTFERLDTLTADALRAERETDIRGERRGLPFVRFVDDAREAFGEWRSDFERTIRAAEGEGLEGALSKFRHHVPALALALHVVDGGTGPVTLPATLRALALAEYFESHARRLHSSGRRMTVRAARTIIQKARAGALPSPFTARDVYRNQWAGLSDRAAAADALDLLVAHDWLAEATIETGGRPTATYSLTEGARRG
jgi:putative DNA primase/helicase